MVAAIVVACTIAFVTLVQAVHVLRTGNSAIWLMQRPSAKAHTDAGVLNRLGRAIVPLAMSLGIMSILIVGLAHVGVSTAIHWLSDHLVNILIPVMVFLIGLFNFIRPTLMTKWVKEANNLTDDADDLCMLIVRIVGVAMMLFSLFILGRFAR